MVIYSVEVLTITSDKQLSLSYLLQTLDWKMVKVFESDFVVQNSKSS